MCLNIRSNTILRVSVRKFLDETNVRTHRLIKQMALPGKSGHEPIRGRPEYDTKSESPMDKKRVSGNSHCLTALKLGHGFSGLWMEMTSSALLGL